MRNIIMAVVVTVLLGCGAEDRGELPGVETAPGSEAAGAESESCLSLVSEARFAEAIPVCTRAVALEPGNRELQDALATAKAEAGEAAAGAAGAASDAEEAARRLGEGM